jgi:hypothetical protein
MRRLLVCAVLMAVLGVGSAALAAPVAKPKKESEVQVFDFEGETVSTEFLRPSLEVVEAAVRGRRSSLILVRLDFVAEIIRSAEDI